MEALRRQSLALMTCLAVMLLVGWPSESRAQNARTANFLVHAPNQQLADAVARSAEEFRDNLAHYWLGQRLPNWPTPCPIEVIAGPNLAAQGVTTYTRSPVGNFQMEVVGTPERILDSVLPHEVTHTVLASHFGRPLPRWADEGICTTVEHSAERNKHEAKLREFLSTRRGIPMNHLFSLTEYPADMLPMYAQGYSVCRFLIEQSGPRRFVEFLEDYFQHPSWTANVRQHYGYKSLANLQQSWLAWVADGSRSVESFVSTRTGNSKASPQRELPAANLAAADPTAENGSLRDSWYKRRHEQTALGTIAAGAAETPPRVSSAGKNSGPNAPASSTVLAPPSVSKSGFYSAAQPQEELSYGESPSYRR